MKAHEDLRNFRKRNPFFFFSIFAIKVLQFFTTDQWHDAPIH